MKPRPIPGYPGFFVVEMTNDEHPQRLVVSQEMLDAAQGEPGSRPWSEIMRGTLDRCLPDSDLARFKRLLSAIAAHDTDYTARYGLVLDALALAHRLGYAAGIRLDADEPEWPVVYIALPTGQVSWHMPQFPKEYDGHDTETKYARIRAFVKEDPR